MSDYKKRVYKTPREIKEEADSDILELLKTMEVKDIVAIYPNMNSHKITKIVTKSMYG
jgi:predicted metal-dependent TIM-barrel fold hydrolase